MTPATVTYTKAGATVSGSWRYGRMQFTNCSGFTAIAVGGGADALSLTIPAITTTVPYLPVAVMVKGANEAPDTGTDSYSGLASNFATPSYGMFVRQPFPWTYPAGTSSAPTLSSPSDAGQVVGFHLGVLGRA